jgi:hypothetical protein
MNTTDNLASIETVVLKSVREKNAEAEAKIKEIK